MKPFYEDAHTKLGNIIMHAEASGRTLAYVECTQEEFNQLAMTYVDPDEAHRNGMFRHPDGPLIKLEGT